MAFASARYIAHYYSSTAGACAISGSSTCAFVSAAKADALWAISTGTVFAPEHPYRDISIITGSAVSAINPDRAPQIDTGSTISWPGVSRVHSALTIATGSTPVTQSQAVNQRTAYLYCGSTPAFAQSSRADALVRLYGSTTFEAVANFENCTRFTIKGSSSAEFIYAFPSGFMHMRSYTRVRFKSYGPDWGAFTVTGKTTPLLKGQGRALRDVSVVAASVPAMGGASVVCRDAAISSSTSVAFAS